LLDAFGTGDFETVLVLIAGDGRVVELWQAVDDLDAFCAFWS
jgi:hypothetical protein